MPVKKNLLLDASIGLDVYLEARIRSGVERRGLLRRPLIVSAATLIHNEIIASRRAALATDQTKSNNNEEKQYAT